MEKLLILFLSLFLCSSVFSQISKKIDCDNRHFQDSLVEKYIDNGAEKLPGIYNNPAWLDYCDSIIAICPNVAMAYREKAIPYIKNGEYEKAFVLENKATELDPKRWTAYRGFLKCMFTKDFEGAILDFQKAQQLTPDANEMDHSYPFFEGVSNLELGNYKLALENFNHDIKIQTGGDKKKSIHFNTLFYMGIVYLEMKDFEKGIEYLSQCLSQYPQHPEANYYLGMIYRQQGKAELSRKYFEMAYESRKRGYGLNEDSMYYVNYPYEVRKYELEEALK